MCRCSLYNVWTSELNFLVLMWFVSGYTASAVGPAAWFPWVPVWLPLRLLWCYPTQLHPAPQPHPQCLSTQHEAPWPFYTQSKGRFERQFQQLLQNFVVEFLFAILFLQSIELWGFLKFQSECYFKLVLIYLTPDLSCLSLQQVDMLSEINIAPRILTNFTGVMPSQFKKDLDSYLKTRSPVTFLSELRSNLQVGPTVHLLNYVYFSFSTNDITI